MKLRMPIKLRRTTQILLFTSSFLGGVVAGRLVEDPGVVVIIMAFCLCIILRHFLPYVGKALIVVILGLLIGLGRGNSAASELRNYAAIYETKVTLTGQALDDAVYGKGGQLTFDVGHLHLNDGRHLVGKLGVRGFGANAVFRGDKVQIVGKLYPGRGSYQARISYAQISVVERKPSRLHELRRSFGASMLSVLPEPQASFALGLLIGQRATLPETVKQDLLVVGLTHIIAVSGYNLTIILRASKRLFTKRSKRLSVGLSVSLILVFLLLTGNSPSIVRAAIVSMLSITAAYYGREIKPLNIILIAAAITAWVKPMYVWGDIGWYLSFLAFYGVIVLAPLLQARCGERIKKSIIGMMAIETICAEIMTLPIVLYAFGQMSLVALAANILVALFVPLAMLGSFTAGLAGMVTGAIAGWLAWPSKIILTYMLDTAHVLASLPNVFIEGIGMSFAQMIQLYTLSVFLTLVLWFKSKAQSAKLTDRTQLFS